MCTPASGLSENPSLIAVSLLTLSAIANAAMEEVVIGFQFPFFFSSQDELVVP
jgi:hypothetical protein